MKIFNEKRPTTVASDDNDDDDNNNSNNNVCCVRKHVEHSINCQYQHMHNFNVTS